MGTPEVGFTDMSKIELATPEIPPSETNNISELKLDSKHPAEDGILVSDKLLSVISHELRNPLTAIIGWTQILLEGKVDAAMTRRALGTINNNAKAQIQLIENLQDFSRLMSGKLKLNTRPVKLIELVNSTIEAVRPAATAKRLTIEKHFEEINAPVDADAGRLTQILTQLLSNAVKFTPSEGRINVHLRRTADQFIEIIVADTGIGVKSEDLPDIFDRMTQINIGTARKRGGLGLGLTIVRKLVELHGGTVKADSPGMNLGATFTARLPVKSSIPNEEIVVAAKTSTLNQAERLDDWKLLIVDDDEDNLDLLTTLFGKFGATVETANSAAAGIVKFQSFQPDLLISDIGMPDEDGYSFIKRVRKLDHPAAKNPAIALTAFTKPEDAARAHAAGFQRHMKKPISPAELINTVAEMLRAAKSD